MDLIPVPELVGAALVCLLFWAVRALFRRWLVPVVRRGAEHRGPREELSPAGRVRVRLIASCVMLALISIPLILQLVPPNGSYGFRIHATQSNRTVWYAANAFMGWAMLTASAICATLLVTLPATTRRWVLWATFLASVFAALAASTAFVAQLP